MGFKNNAYATLWKNKQTNEVVNYHKNEQGITTYAEINISTSKKNKQTNQYETDFSASVRFIGHALNKLKEMVLEERDRIKILEAETTNSYSQDTKKTYVNYVCWDFEPIGEIQKQTPKVEIVTETETLEPIVVDEATLPF